MCRRMEFGGRSVESLVSPPNRLDGSNLGINSLLH